MAADCRAQLDRLAVQRPVGIVGLSLGAMVATRWAHDEPSSIDRLVLINTSLRPLAPMHWRLRPAAAARLLWRLLTANARRLEETVLELTSARHDSAVIDNWLALHALHPVSRANALRQLLAAARFSAPPSAARPTLLLAGNGDRLVDPRCSERIARAWGMPLAMHPWAGHDLPLDDAAWVIDQIRLWLDAARGAASATTDSD
jgi:pimeloyl-ACP methyl ester carboxylesterase